MRDPETGKGDSVPSNMKYEDWKNKFAVENPEKSGIMESVMKRNSSQGGISP